MKNAVKQLYLVIVYYTFQRSYPFGWYSLVIIHKDENNQIEHTPY